MSSRHMWLQVDDGVKLKFMFFFLVQNVLLAILWPDTFSYAMHNVHEPASMSVGRIG